MSQRFPAAPGIVCSAFSTGLGAMRLAKPPSNPIRLVSKLRTGPATVLSWGWQVPPPLTQASDGLPGTQAAPAWLPPSQTPASAAPGARNGSRSGGAVGMGPARFAANPLNPLSSPSRFAELFGLVNGPKLRWRDAPANGTGPMNGPFNGWSENRNVPAAQPPHMRASY